MTFDEQYALPDDQACENCYYWRALPPSKHPQCLRFPPGPTLLTSPTNWCGEWKSYVEKPQ